MISIIIIGLSIGLAGSFHCVGMCGPLALSLPLNNNNRTTRITAIVFYNLGRVFTYFLLGILFGAIGSSLFLTGYQQALSIVIGSIILLVVLFGNRFNARIRTIDRFHQKIKLILSNLLRQEKTVLNFSLIGMVNGLLPCGLVYLAIGSAIATGSVMGGGILMAAFGFGTIPLMFALMVAGRYVSAAVRQKMRKLVPVFVGMVACLMILRGLGLNIPYVSPQFTQNEKKEVMSCPTPEEGMAH
ncbi:MAG: sulfite exporter TauE/SafE family protein [Niabella sp.]